MALMNFTGRMLKNLFSKPATTQYPYVKKEYMDRTRGQIAINIDDCIFCGICSKKCPTRAIEVDRTKKNWQIGRFGCIQCAACVEACPKKCLLMKNQYATPGAEKVWESFSKAEPENTAESGDTKQDA